MNEDAQKNLKEIGELFRATREKRRTKIDTVVKKLKIRKKFIDAIENGNFQEIVSEIYMSGYLRSIRSYSDWLGLETDRIIKDIESCKIGTLGSSSAHPMFQYYQRKAIFPPKIAVLASLLMTLAVYLVWANSSEIAKFRDTVVSSVVAKNNKNQISEPLASFDKIVLLAEDDINVKILNVEDKSFYDVALKAGETYFISDIDKVKITTDKPKMLEVFMEGSESKYLGNLKDIKNFSFVDKQE